MPRLVENHGRHDQRGQPRYFRTGTGYDELRDGDIAVLAYAFPGNKPDVTEIPLMIDELGAPHATANSPEQPGQPDLQR